jgi:hypothetical protein
VRIEIVLQTEKAIYKDSIYPATILICFAEDTAGKIKKVVSEDVRRGLD